MQTIKLDAADWFSATLKDKLNLPDGVLTDVYLDYSEPKLEDNKLKVGLGWIRNHLQQAMDQINQIDSIQSK